MGSQRKLKPVPIHILYKKNYIILLTFATIKNEREKYGGSSVTHLDKRKMFVYIMWNCEFNKVGSLAFIVSLDY